MADSNIQSVKIVPKPDYHLLLHKYSMGVNNTCDREKQNREIEYVDENESLFTETDIINSLVNTGGQLSYEDQVHGCYFPYLPWMSVCRTCTGYSVYICMVCNATGSERGLVHRNDCSYVDDLELLFSDYTTRKNEIDDLVKSDPNDPRIADLKNLQIEEVKDSKLYWEFESAFDEFKISVPETIRNELSTREIGVMWIRARLTQFYVEY